MGQCPSRAAGARAGEASSSQKSQEELREARLRAVEARAAAASSLPKTSQSPLEECPQLTADGNAGITSSSSSSKPSAILAGNKKLSSTSSLSASIARQAQEASAKAAAQRAEAAQRAAATARELAEALERGDLRKDGMLMRVAVGEGQEPLRCYVNHHDFGQYYWDQGHSMNHAGFAHRFGFWALTARRPGTMRIAVGVSGEPLTMGPAVCLVNPLRQASAADWDAGDQVEGHGFTPQLSFWAYTARQPGTIRVALAQALSGPSRTLLLHAPERGDVTLPPGFSLAGEFWAYSDPGPLPCVPPDQSCKRLMRYAGYIPGGGDLLQARMTVRQAKARCKQLAGCLGFTYQGKASVEDVPVTIYFKDKWILAHGDDWVSYRLLQQGQFDPDSPEDAPPGPPAEYDVAKRTMCLRTEHLSACLIEQRAAYLKRAWRGQTDAEDSLALSAGRRAFPENATTGEAFYVMVHCDFGFVRGFIYDDFPQASRRFKALEGGGLAAMMVDKDFKELMYYGQRGQRLDDFRDWWSRASQDVHIRLLHDDATPIVGLATVLRELTLPGQVRDMLQGWRAELLPALLRFLASAAEPGDAAASLLLLAYCAWRLTGDAVCPAIARRSFDKCLLSLRLANDGEDDAPAAPAAATDPCAEFRDWLKRYIEMHKEQAFASGFLEPSRLYWRRLYGSCTQEQDVDNHAAFAYAGLVQKTLGVKCSLPIMWDDNFSVHGIVEFLAADFLSGALRAMERLENFGQAYGKLVRKPDEADKQPRAVPLACARFIFAGARSPQAMAVRASGEEFAYPGERATLARYLERFAVFFREDFFLEAACNAVLADEAASRACADVLRLLCQENAAVGAQAAASLGEKNLGASSEALCRAVLWEFDEHFFPKFNVQMAALLFRRVGGILKD
eukprot:TRINITY_DN73210_c0_g1_i1.p1 TRINITY_DN73210_c0_g1~~TRINITY_DN73210_c0_g1_i1.p1  ORF type:complete len:904 (+),score=204.45 TRINITY_DN73210_c0_g1_i1:97-2808(+)